MSLEQFFNALGDTSIAVAIREGATTFPWIESVHVLAITLVVGTIAIVDLRLIGYPSHRRGARKLITELLPYTWAAFAVAVIAGLLLFVSAASAYAHNSQFQAKMLMILAAGSNMVIFHLSAYRRIADWDDALPPPPAVRAAGGLSLFFWIVVIFLGRWVGFTLEPTSAAASAFASEPAPALSASPSQTKQTDVQTETPFITTTTIKELMDSTIDPSADVLWESVAIKSTKEGVQDLRPRTDEEWKELRRHAITLLEATNLLVIDGRRAAPPGTQAGLGELTPEQIDLRIAASRPAFVQFVRALRGTTQQALDAIDRKDADALLMIGGDIDEACEACHVTYWYPSSNATRSP